MFGLVEMIERDIDAAGGKSLERCSSQELAKSLVGLRRVMDRLAAETARHVARLSQPGRCSELGYPSATALLKHRARMSGGRAKAVVAEARALSFMPVTSKLASEGVISTDQVRVLVSAWETNPEMFSEHETALAEIAREVPWVSTLATAVSYWRQAVSDLPEAEDEDKRDQRYLFCSATFEGMVKLDALLDPESGETVLSALAAATAPPGLSDPRTSCQRRADALVDIATACLGPSRPRLEVHVSYQTLTELVPELSETASGAVLSPGSVRRLSCDANIARIIFGEDSLPLDVGRNHRVVPAWIRRAVVARDHHCTYSGCDRPERWCDVHHIIHWIEGGETKLSNLRLLCRFHHTLTHCRGPSG